MRTKWKFGRVFKFEVVKLVANSPAIAAFQFFLLTACLPSVNGGSFKAGAASKCGHARGQLSLPRYVEGFSWSTRRERYDAATVVDDEQPVWDRVAWQHVTAQPRR